MTTKLFECPKCGDFEFSMTEIAHQQSTVYVNLSLGGCIENYIDYGKEYGGDSEEIYDTFECCDCGESFNFKDYWPELVEKQERAERLKETAPDMLEALQETVRILSNQPLHFLPLIDKLNAVITKATKGD